MPGRARPPGHQAHRHLHGGRRPDHRRPRPSRRRDRPACPPTTFAWRRADRPGRRRAGALRGAHRSRRGAPPGPADDAGASGARRLARRVRRPGAAPGRRRVLRCPSVPGARGRDAGLRPGAPSHSRDDGCDLHRRHDRDHHDERHGRRRRFDTAGSDDTTETAPRPAADTATKDSGSGGRSNGRRSSSRGEYDHLMPKLAEHAKLEPGLPGAAAAARRAGARAPAGRPAHRPALLAARRAGGGPRAGRDPRADQRRRPVRPGPRHRLPVLRGADDHRRGPSPLP